MLFVHMRNEKALNHNWFNVVIGLPSKANLLVRMYALLRAMIQQGLINLTAYRLKGDLNALSLR